MSVEQESGSAIESVFVVPRNTRYCMYYLNGGDEGHRKTYHDMGRYLTSLMPNRAEELMDLATTFRMFLVVPAADEIILFEREEMDFERQLAAKVRRPPRQRTQRSNMPDPRKLQRHIDSLISKLQRDDL